MTCLELMKKLRPDLSENYIIDYFCPDTHELHMRKETPRFSFGCHSCVLSCYDCWNQEVDEEVLYFQDEKECLLKELKIKNVELRLENLELSSDRKKLIDENVCLDERIEELESENNRLKTEINGLSFKCGYHDGMNNATNEELRRNYLAMRENFDSAMELVSKRDHEIDELKERVEYLETARDSIVKEYEQSMINCSKLRKENENLKHALDDSWIERDSFRRENEFFKEKIRDLKQKAKELKSESTPWRTNDGC